MSDARARAKHRQNVAGYACLALIGVAILYTALNQYGGPYELATGHVVGSGTIPNDGPPLEIVSVRLANGDLVQARVVHGGPANVGSVAHLRVYRRVLSRRHAYEAFKFEDSQ